MFHIVIFFSCSIKYTIAIKETNLYWRKFYRIKWWTTWLLCICFSRFFVMLWSLILFLKWEEQSSIWTIFIHFEYDYFPLKRLHLNAIISQYINEREREKSNYIKWKMINIFSLYTREFNVPTYIGRERARERQLLVSFLLMMLMR